jgi:hypothetical protein
VDYLAPWPKSQGLFLGHQGLPKPHPGGCPALAFPLTVIKLIIYDFSKSLLLAAET